jgi:hypothetical protein
MRSRAERNQDFEAIKTNLFEAGVAVVKAAKAHEDMFHTSLEAIATAMELNLDDSPQLSGVVDGTHANLIYEVLRSQRQEAEVSGDYDLYVAIEEKLQRLEEFEAQRLDRQARSLEAQVRIQTARHQLARSQTVEAPASALSRWTEASLKSTFKTLKAVRAALGIAARSWKEAVEQANQADASDE